MSRPRGPTLTETILRESLSGRELVRLPFATRRLARAPRGSGHPVLLLPGLGASDTSLTPLREYLTRLGHDARPLGLGRMRPDVARIVPQVVALVERISVEASGPVALVGQSLGGVISREVARQTPQFVRRIVTFGSPVIGGPSYTATRQRYTAAQRRTIEQLVDTRNQIPITVPVTAMWSRNDGIVAPVACIDPNHPDIEHVEVSSSHLGMGLDPDVWGVVADRLAR